IARLRDGDGEVRLAADLRERARRRITGLTRAQLDMRARRRGVDDKRRLGAAGHRSAAARHDGARDHKHSTKHRILPLYARGTLSAALKGTTCRKRQVDGASLEGIPPYRGNKSQRPSNSPGAVQLKPLNLSSNFTPECSYSVMRRVTSA